MRAGAPWQVLADCPYCRTEAAVIELMDPAHPACASGVPSDRRCRMCGWHEVASPSGEPMIPKIPPAKLRDARTALQALRSWAAEEGETDVGIFVRGSFGAEPDEIVDRLVRGDPVPTTFDVIAFLFPSAGGASVQRAIERLGEGEPPVAAVAPVDRTAPAPADVRTPARLLVSVMVADGTIRAGERRFLVRFLEQEGLPPFASGDLRVWRPSELGPAPEPELRDRVLEAAVHLMHLDRERDGSEWRVIRTFARAWGVDDARLDGWDRAYERRYGPLISRLGRWIVRLLRGALPPEG